jgi:hypothetical protein
MRILRPAALADIPSSRAATNRCRKSDEYGFPIHADLPPGSQHESEIQHHGNPQRFNLIGPDFLAFSDQSGSYPQAAK